MIDKPSKKNNKKVALKKAVKEVKKELPKKAAPAEALREGREEIKQEIKEPEAIKEEILEPVRGECPTELKAETDVSNHEQPLNLDEPMAIYLGAKDMEGYQLVSTIQYEILKYWKPPMGLPSGIECKVNIKVDKDGKVEDFKIEKSSNILAYDISLRNAILKSIMPNEIRGREFTLTLNC